MAQNPASDQMTESSTKKVSTKRRKIEPEEADGDLDAQVRKLHGKGQLSKVSSSVNWELAMPQADPDS